jgi:UDP-N-acetylglucosamine:LPS N-acetylglucosamine transferase
MDTKKILFVSGSLGLGHVTRDLEISKELAAKVPNIDISWLAYEPASSVIKNAGGKLVPEAELLINDNIIAESVAKGTELNLFKYSFKALSEWNKNVEIFRKIIQRQQFDLIIGDETYDINIAMIKNKLKINTIFIAIFDFIGLDAMTLNPVERIGVYYINRLWAKSPFTMLKGNNKALFVGELEDIQNKRFGFLLPNRRSQGQQYYHFLGYILAFNPEQYLDREKIRARLGYGKEPLLICSIGGTAVGKTLLEICGQAFHLVKNQIPDLRMILVGGPNLDMKSLVAPEGVEVRQYIPALYEHFAACDMAVVQAGGTTTLELTALQRPFVYIPQKNHCEQNLTVCARLKRHHTGIRMDYDTLTPQSLTEVIVQNIGKPVSYEKIPVNGGRRAAELIGQLLV